MKPELQFLLIGAALVAIAILMVVIAVRSISSEAVGLKLPKQS